MCLFMRIGISLRPYLEENVLWLKWTDAVFQPGFPDVARCKKGLHMIFGPLLCETHSLAESCNLSFIFLMFILLQCV